LIVAGLFWVCDFPYLIREANQTGERGGHVPAGDSVPAIRVQFYGGVISTFAA